MYVIICVFIMFLVSYLPRALPITFLKGEIKSSFIKSFLFYVPYAVMATLTFPSIFYSTNDIYTALIGTITASILAILRIKMIIIVLITVLVVFICQFIM